MEIHCILLLLITMVNSSVSVAFINMVGVDGDVHPYDMAL